MMNESTRGPPRHGPAPAICRICTKLKIRSLLCQVSTPLDSGTLFKPSKSYPTVPNIEMSGLCESEQRWLAEAAVAHERPKIRSVLSHVACSGAAGARPASVGCRRQEWLYAPEPCFVGSELNGSAVLEDTFASLLDVYLLLSCSSWFSRSASTSPFPASPIHLLLQRSRRLPGTTPTRTCNIPPFRAAARPLHRSCLHSRGKGDGFPLLLNPVAPHLCTHLPVATSTLQQSTETWPMSPQSKTKSRRWSQVSKLSLCAYVCFSPFCLLIAHDRVHIVDWCDCCGKPARSRITQMFGPGASDPLDACATIGRSALDTAGFSPRCYARRLYAWSLVSDTASHAVEECPAPFAQRIFTGFMPLRFCSPYMLHDRCSVELHAPGFIS
ncbi:hypothetical protein C8Q79DRAFT_252775 [Trametes meyenii]|nr:hypothetical protein C8Q79DRAFT_252775 [Trametes meyenii]